MSERARRRAEELARDADLRTTVPRPPKQGDGGAVVTVKLPAKAAESGHDRMPGPGTVLTRTYRGRRIAVTVLADGFEFEGNRYRSLSAVAREVTGTQWNGHVFFGLKSSKR